MALRIPTKTSDRLTVVSYLDDAIDYDHPEIDKIVKTYIEADTPDFNTLPMSEGLEPTKFVIRPLSEREMAIAADMARTYHAAAPGEVSIDHNNSEANYQVLRFGLVDVVNLEGWAGKRERIYSTTAWTMGSVEDIDSHTAEFLALSIRRWSTLQKKTNSRSTLQPAASSGINPTAADTGRLTVTSAKETKGTQGPTGVTKRAQAARGR